MCNFIIRPIKSYATVDVAASKVVSNKVPVSFENIVIKQGSTFDVKRVDSGYVYGLLEGEESEVCVNMDDFVHTFSNKDPNAKEEKKKN